MKTLYLVGGTMGVGKTAVCQALKQKLDNCVFLDGDWCWDADPFRVTPETKEMVLQNIIFLLNQFLHCPAYDNVVFGWVMHEQQIIDTIVAGLDTAGCNVKVISLLCSENSLRERIQKDIVSGKRTPDSIERSVVRIPLYEKLNTTKIMTDGKSVDQVAEEISAK